MHRAIGMDVGTTLRIARERRGLSLAQLAATTKITVGVLQSIDDNAFDRVPRGIFVRGFIRAYAREVGLDAEETIAQFLSETAETLPAEPAAPTSHHGAIDQEIAEIDALQIDLAASGSRPGWGYALIVAALVIGIVSFNRSGASDEDTNAPVAVADAATSDAAAAAIDDVETIATTGGVLRVEIQARGECWVKAIVDGRTVIARLMLPGERISTDAQHDVVLRVGDPAAVTYSINGRPGRALGEAGTAVTVRFTRDGRQNTLAS